MRQTCKDFVWLVIDDGSIDNTKEMVERWRKDADFPIKYIYRENGGMHAAHNTAYQNIDTELNTCIDSDDYMPDNAVEKIVNFWKRYGGPDYAGLVGLDITEDGKVIGTKFPDELKETTLSGFYARGGRGDKKLVYRTDVITSVPEYPVFEGEKYLSLGYKYLLIDQKYKLLVLNEPLVVVEYLTDGSSLNIFRQYVRNPRGFSFIRKVNMIYAPSAKRKFMDCIHYISSSIMLKNSRFIAESPAKLITILAIPAGLALFLYIKSKTHGKDCK